MAYITYTLLVVFGCQVKRLDSPLPGLLPEIGYYRQAVKAKHLTDDCFCGIWVVVRGMRTD